MLIQCPKCHRRHEVPRSGSDLLATCPCGQKFKVFAWLSYKRILSERGRVTCPICCREHDLGRFRIDTELACVCGCLFLVKTASAAAKARGRRKADQSDRLLEKELHGLIETSKLIHGAAHDLDKLLAMVIRIAAETVDSEGASIALRDKEGGLVFRFVASEKDASRLASLRLAAGEGIVGDCVAKRMSLIVNNPAADRRFSRKGDERTGSVTRSVLCVPLVVDAVCIGAVEMVNKKSHDGFSRHDLVLAEGLSDQIAVAVRNALRSRIHHKPATQPKA